MEAKKFGFGDMSAAFKFDPTDDELVTLYLLPRAIGVPSPHAHAIIEDDPGSVPPWEILKRHGHEDSDHAFFFGPPTPASQSGDRRSRTVQGGGVWQGQMGLEDTATLVHPDGTEVDIRYQRYDLAFYLAERGPSTGYVMQEFQIVSPPLPDTVVARIKVQKNAYRPLVADADADGADEQDGGSTGPTPTPRAAGPE
ncbi:unnamed protein product [Alopecurus aequalis]